jgi:hypothetical protein
LLKRVKMLQELEPTKTKVEIELPFTRVKPVSTRNGSQLSLARTSSNMIPLISDRANKAKSVRRKVT